MMKNENMMTETKEKTMKTSPSSVRLFFTRRFVRGMLAGLTHNDTISFVSMERAADWIRGIRANAKLGKIDYELADYAFQKYWRD